MRTGTGQSKIALLYGEKPVKNHMVPAGCETVQNCAKLCNKIGGLDRVPHGEFKVGQAKGGSWSWPAIVKWFCTVPHLFHTVFNPVHTFSTTFLHMTPRTVFHHALAPCVTHMCSSGVFTVLCIHSHSHSHIHVSSLCHSITCIYDRYCVRHMHIIHTHVCCSGVFTTCVVYERVHVWHV